MTSQTPAPARATLLAFAAVALVLAAQGGHAALSGEPQGWIARIEQDRIGAEYDLSWQAAPAAEGIGPSWHAPNRAQGFRTYFAPEGIRIVPRKDSGPSWRWGMTLVAYGMRGASMESPRATLAPRGRVIEYLRGALQERYENMPRGLEQTFVLSEAPGESGSGAVVHIDLQLWGDLLPRIAADGQAIDFVTPAGEPVLHYAELKAIDARGDVLPARMEAFIDREKGRGGIRLVVDAGRAAYPVTIDPLTTSPAWSAEGDQANANFGLSVATAGDVNGDGFSDVIVGAPFFDSGQSDEGRAFLYLGSASGLAAAPAWTAESNLAGAWLGTSVAAAGDVNRDGYSDIIVGAPGGNQAYVFLGGFGGLSSGPAWVATSPLGSASFGQCVGSAGDVNGDGYSDVVVGAPDSSNGQFGEGRVYVYQGSASGPVIDPSTILESNVDLASFGFSASTAGDVNGDGYSDVIVGAYQYSHPQTFEGAAFLFPGSASGLSTSPAWTIEGDQDVAELGVSVSTAGDVNGDGYSDVVVGAWLYDNGEANEGIAALYLGSSTGLAPSYSWFTQGNQGEAYLGRYVGMAGDVNGDGYSDLLIGAVGHDNGQTDEGRALLFFGSPSGPPTAPGWTAESDQGFAQFGTSVTTAGDVNGDGYSDVIAGATYFDNGQINEGRAFVYLGSPGLPETLPGWQVEAAGQSVASGSWTSASGDVNGDGYADILVGTPWHTSGGFTVGKAELFLGSADGPGTTPAWSVEGNVERDVHFGEVVDIAGDVNGDGYADVLVGSPDTESVGITYVDLFLGSPSGLAATPAWSAASPQPSQTFGYAIAGAGDVNGDGYADVLIGSPLEGRVYLFFGSAAGLGASPAWTMSAAALSRPGISVAGAGDTNGDGYADFLVGTLDTGGYVCYGSVGTPDCQYFSQDGLNVASVGDVNGDGYSDAVSAAYDSSNGYVSLVFGSAGGLQNGSPVTLAGGGYFGRSVAGSDVNGDGYSDIIIANAGGTRIYLGSPVPPGAPSWTSSPPAGSSSNYGTQVATGDVNGDGCSDILIGDPSVQVVLHYGNGGRGVSLRPQQRRLDGSAPIALGGRSPSASVFGLSTLGRTPYGRGRVRLESETKPLRTLFNGAGIQPGNAPVDTGTEGANLTGAAGPLDPGAYHWRVRLRYDPVTMPHAPASRWFTIPWHGWNETDVTLGAFLGGTVWDDLDADGVRDSGEPEHGGVVVSLLSGSGATIDQRTTPPNGFYQFALPGPGSFRIQVTRPGGTIFSPQDLGGDDMSDSDVDANGYSPLVGPAFVWQDLQRWSAGLVSCPGPTQPVVINVVRTPVGGNNAILDVTDPNPSGSVTGYNIYRSTQPQPSPAPWTLLAGDAGDMDLTTPGFQWIEATPDAPAIGGAFFYQVTATNHICQAEGPR